MGMLSRAAKRLVLGSARSSRWAIAALAASILLWAVLAVQTPMLSQAKGKKAQTGILSKQDFEKWDDHRLKGEVGFNQQMAETPGLEQGCENGVPSVDPSWKLAMQPAVIGARRLAKDPWEVMAEWGHTLDGRSPSYPTRAKGKLVSDASTEIFAGAVQLALAEELLASAFEGLEFTNCNQGENVFKAGSAGLNGLPKLKKGFSDLEKAGLSDVRKGGGHHRQ